MPPAAPAPEPSEGLARVQRWEEFGGTWQLVHADGSLVTVALCRCDGGAEVERLTSDAADLRRHVAGG